VEVTGVECIWATLREEKRSRAEARRRVLFAFMGPAPGVKSRGGLSETTVTRKFLKSSEKWRPAPVLERAAMSYELRASSDPLEICS
jgi:hypothetical protein